MCLPKIMRTLLTHKTLQCDDYDSGSRTRCKNLSTSTMNSFYREVFHLASGVLLINVLAIVFRCLE